MYDSHTIKSYLVQLNQTLEERVGTEITENLTDEQLEHLITLQDAGNDEKIGTWLKQNIPELDDIIQDEIEILLSELSEDSGTIS